MFQFVGIGAPEEIFANSLTLRSITSGTGCTCAAARFPPRHLVFLDVCVGGTWVAGAVEDFRVRAHPALGKMSRRTGLGRGEVGQREVQGEPALAWAFAFQRRQKHPWPYISVAAMPVWGL